MSRAVALADPALDDHPARSGQQVFTVAHVPDAYANDSETFVLDICLDIVVRHMYETNV